MILLLLSLQSLLNVLSTLETMFFILKLEIALHFGRPNEEENKNFEQTKEIHWLDRYGDCICCLGTHIPTPLHPEDDEVPIVNSSSASSSEADSL